MRKLMEEGISWQSCPQCPPNVSITWYTQPLQPHFSNRTQAAVQRSTSLWLEILPWTSTGHSWEFSKTCRNNTASVRNVKNTGAWKGPVPGKAYFSEGSTTLTLYAVVYSNISLCRLSITRISSWLGLKLFSAQFPLPPNSCESGHSSPHWDRFAYCFLYKAKQPWAVPVSDNCGVCRFYSVLSLVCLQKLKYSRGLIDLNHCMDAFFSLQNASFFSLMYRWEPNILPRNHSLYLPFFICPLSLYVSFQIESMSFTGEKKDKAGDTKDRASQRIKKD